MSIYYCHPITYNNYDLLNGVFLVNITKCHFLSSTSILVCLGQEVVQSLYMKRLTSLQV